MNLRRIIPSWPRPPKRVSVAMVKLTACTPTWRPGAKFGINVLLAGLGHFCVLMEPFSTRRFSLVFGGSILIAPPPSPFTDSMLICTVVPQVMEVLIQVQVLLQTQVLLMYAMTHPVNRLEDPIHRPHLHPPTP